MLKKMLLVVAAMLALSATAAPASTLAWTHGESELGQNVPIKFASQLGIVVAAGPSGAHFDVVMEGELFPGGNGVFNKITVGACKGTGALIGLTCTGTINAFPWNIEQLPGGNIEVKGVDYTLDFYAPNDATHKTKIAASNVVGDLTLKPDKKTSMSSVVIESSKVTANGNPATMSGVLAVEPAGTYGTE